MEMEGFLTWRGDSSTADYVYFLGTTAHLAHVMHSSLGKLEQLRRGLCSLCSLLDDCGGALM